MSTAIELDNVIKEISPLWDFESEQKFKYRQGASNVTMKRWPGPGSSSSQLIFNAIQLPSPTSILDPRVFVETKFQVSVVGTTVGIPPSAAEVYAYLRSNIIPRYMPITRSANNITVEIGDGSFSSKPNNYIHALGHYSDCYNLSERELSIAPAFMDKVSSYEVSPSPAGDVFLYGERSPFASYSSNPYVVPRGGYNGGPVITGTPAVGAVTYTITFTVIEPVFCSPLTYGSEVRGLTNFSTNTVTINLSPQLKSLVSVRDLGVLGLAPNTTTFARPSLTLNTNFNNASSTFLYATYITAKERIPDILHYPYHPIAPYEVSAIAVPSVAVGTLAENIPFTSASIQLPSIPKRLYVYVEEALSSKSEYSADTFGSITQFELFIGNSTAQLSQARQLQLYQMSQRNGCQLSWSEFSNPLLTGSPICIDFAKDIGLEEDWIVGKNGPLTAYFEGMVDMPGQGKTYNAVLRYVYVFDGYITIVKNGAVTSYSSTFSTNQSERELMDADFSPWVVNPDAMYYGGASMREIGSKIYNVVKGKIIPSARWVASQIMKHPDQVATVANAVLGVIPGGDELVKFAKAVEAFLPQDLKDRARNALLNGAGRKLEQGQAGGTFSGGAMAKSGLKKASMMDLCRR